MHWKEDYKKYIDENLGEITERIANGFAREIFYGGFNIGYEKGLRLGINRTESRMLRRQDNFEKAMKKTLHLEMIRLLAKHKNNYFALQEELSKLIFSL